MKEKYFLKKLSYYMLAFFILMPFISYATESPYIIDNGKVFHIRTDGTKEELTDQEIKSASYPGGMNWILVDNSSSSEKNGVYFFDDKDRFISFLPSRFPSSYRISFARSDSERKNYMLIFSGYGAIMDFEVYDFETLTLKESFGIRFDYSWLDNEHYLFVIHDGHDGNKFNPRYGDSGIYLSSLVIYNIFTQERIIIKSESETENFEMKEYNWKDRSVEIEEEVVKNVEDWDDEDKIQKKNTKFMLDDFIKKNTL